MMNRSQSYLFWGLLLLGLLLRGWHYGRLPSIWHDEAALVVNVVDLDFVALWGSLHHHEAAPPLFLWLERLVVLTLGDDLYSLRLIPFLASCLSLFLFASLARRLLSISAMIWAVGLFAVSDRLLWHACEAKPYAVDVLIAVAMAWGFDRTQSWSFRSRCLLWMPLAPVLIWLSYPACFLCGGLLTALGIDWLTRSGWRLRTDTVAFGSLILLIAVAFVALALGPAKAQRDGAMEDCWLNHFPNWNRPALVPLWTITSTLDLFRYLLEPCGYPLILFFLWSVYHRFRACEYSLLALLLVPLGAVWFAACLRSYPYGGARIIVFLAPAVILLVAQSIPELLQRGRQSARWIPIVTVAVLLLPFAKTAYHLVEPWYRADTLAAAEYVQNHHQAGEGIAINHWEYEYLLRNHAPLHTLPEMPEEPPTRMWFVLCGENAEAILAVLRPAWITLDHKQFTGATAVLMARRDKSPPAGLDFDSGDDKLKTITFKTTLNRR